MPPRWPDADAGTNGTGHAIYDGRDGYARNDAERDGLPVLPPSGVSGWPSGEPVARRTANGWRVGDEEVSDLTSAMVLADLLAADLPTQAMPATASGPADAAARGGAGPAQGSAGPAQGSAGPAQGSAGPAQGGAGPAQGGPGTAQGGPGRAQDSTGTPRGGEHRSARSGPGDEVVDPERLQVTVAQLEHALSARVRVEQAIGVLAERHRLRPRQAFELLRSVARASGRRVMEVATEVVDSATNPLLRIPEELAKPPAARRRGRIARRLPENS